MFTQLITPNPNIRCTPGWCLQYVRESFGLPVRYGSATEAWQKSASQHRDRNFPTGMYVPVWFTIDIEPNGHVALLTPDGSVYSSSDMTNTPHHHPSIDELISYYARWGKMKLTYLGWTEDVAGYPVIAASGINSQGTIKASEDDELLSAEAQNWLKENLLTKADGAYQNDRALTKADGAYMNNTRDAQFAAVMDALGKTLNKDDGGYIVKLVQAIKPGTTDVKAVADAIAGIIPEAIAKDVANELAARLGGK